MNSNASSMTSESHDWSLWRVVLAYGLVAIVFIGLIWAVLAYGQSLTPAVASTATETAAKAGAAHKLSPLYHVLLALVSILLLGRWMGKTLRPLRPAARDRRDGRRHHAGAVALRPNLAGTPNTSCCQRMSRRT